MRRIATVVLAAAFLVAAGCAHTAPKPTTKTAFKASPKTLKQFAKVKDEIHAAFEALPTKFGADPVGEMQAIEKASAGMKTAEAGLTPDLKKLPTYPTLTNNLAALKQRIEEATLLQHCSATRRRILDVHHAGHKATAAELKALSDAVAALGRFEGKAHADVVAPWHHELDRLTKENDQIVPLRTQIPGPPMTPPEKARYQAKMATVSAAANQAVAALEASVARTKGALPASELTALGTAATKVEAVDPKAARYYTHRLEAFQLVSDLRGASTATAKAFAARLGGTAAKDGRTRGRRLEVRIAGKKGTCYTLFAPDRTRFRAARAAGAIHYAIEDATYDGMGATGLCLTRPGRVTFSATVARRHAPYVVVAIPQAKMPLFLVVYLAVERGDPCDLPVWKAEWLDPIPGTVVWGGTAPFLVTRVSPPGQQVVSLGTASGGSVRATKLQLVDDPPQKVKFTTPVFFPGCQGHGPKGIQRAFTATVKEIRKAWTAHPIRAPFDRAAALYDHGRAWVTGKSPDAGTAKKAGHAKK